MLSWLTRPRTLPPLSPENPGQGPAVRVGFSDADRTGSDKADVVRELAEVLRSRGVRLVRHRTQLDLADGLSLRPQFLRLQPRDNGAVSTSTTIEINHPSLCPAGTFEYQHAAGASPAEALRSGFEGWADTDLPVFTDALRDRLETCTAMEASGEGWPRRRQIIFGPPAHAVLRQAAPSADDHPFCPCCLLTNCLDAFVTQLQRDAFCGVRLYAARDAEGVAQADCRINGVDWAAGQEALLRYVATWPDRGFEFRKQFVAIRSLPER